MKTDIQRFKDFKHRHRLSYEDIVKIVSEYAGSDLDKARTFFSKKYDISKAVFYKSRDFAVICHLVDDKTCEMLRDKAAKNNASHNSKNSATSSYKHYADLYERRIRFFSEVSEDKIMDISQKYAEGVMISSIANAYEVCEETVKKLLKRGVEEVIVPTSLVIEIEGRMDRERKNTKAFQLMMKRRTEKKKETLDPWKREIMVLEYQISKYDSYFCGDENVPEKVFLEKRLDEVQKKYRRILAF